MSRIDTLADAVASSIGSAFGTLTIEVTDDPKNKLDELAVDAGWLLLIVTKAERSERVARSTIYKYEFDLELDLMKKIDVSIFNTETREGKKLADDIEDHLKTAGRLDGAALSEHVVDLVYSAGTLQEHHKFIGISTVTYRKDVDLE